MRRDHAAGAPGTAILVEGRADQRGTNEYTLAPGHRRARAAADYPVSHRGPGVSDGEERPLCTERTESCRAKARRVCFRATAGQEPAGRPAR